MARTLAMFTDTSLCIGCRACQVACKQWNELPMEEPEWTGGYQNHAHFTDKTYRLVRFIEKPQAARTAAAAERIVEKIVERITVLREREKQIGRASCRERVYRSV